MTFLTTLKFTGILCSFTLVREGKAGKEIPESSKLEFLEKFPLKNLFYQMQKRYSKFTFGLFPVSLVKRQYIMILSIHII